MNGLDDGRGWVAWMLLSGDKMIIKSTYTYYYILVSDAQWMQNVAPRMHNVDSHK